MLTNSNFYIGDSSVSRLYQGENLVWDASHPDILCEWISNGDASTNPDVYFNTFMNPDLTLKVETKYSYHNRNYSGGAALFGSRASATDSRYYLFTFTGLQIDGQSLYTAKFWFKNQEGYSAVVPTLDEPHVITTCATYSSASAATAVNCILDGSTTSRAVTINQALSNTHQMYMFAINNQGTVDYRCLADTRIYYMKIWRDNRLARFFIPVLHWLNGQYVPCFYDKVTDIYIYNLGTDTPTYKMTGDYLLNYIQCGNDYLDQTTGTRCYIRYNPQLTVDLGYELHMKVNPGNAYYNSPATPQEAFIIGERVSGTAKIGFYMPNASYGIRTAWLNAVSTLWSGNPAGTDFRISWTINQSDRKRSAWVNDSSVQNAGTEASSVPEELAGANIYINKCGASNVWAGNKYYYIIIDKFTINQRTYVPVLHNGQAMFLDLNNSTYMQHTVDSGSGADNTLIYSF